MLEDSRALPDQGVDHVVLLTGGSIFGPLETFDAAKWRQSCSKMLGAQGAAEGRQCDVSASMSV